MTKSKKKIIHRSKNLTDDAIENIVRILDGWSGKLTWEELINTIVVKLHYRYTRQTLHKHERIRAAYSQKKDALSNIANNTTTHETSQKFDKNIIHKIARLEAENQRLKTENQRLLEQFVVWAYNAHVRGLTKEYLSQPLPHVNRDQTLLSERK